MSLWYICIGYTTFFMAQQNLAVWVSDGAFTATLSVQNDITMEVIFVKGRARFRPTFKKSDYAKIISPIKEDFIGSAGRLVRASSRYDDRFLCDIEFSEGSPSTKKWSYVKYSLYVKPKGRDCTLREHADAIRPIVNSLNRLIRNEFEAVGFEMKEPEND